MESQSKIPLVQYISIIYFTKPWPPQYVPMTFATPLNLKAFIDFKLKKEIDLIPESAFSIKATPASITLQKKGKKNFNLVDWMRYQQTRAQNHRNFNVFNNFFPPRLSSITTSHSLRISLRRRRSKRRSSAIACFHLEE